MQGRGTRANKNSYLEVLLMFLISISQLVKNPPAMQDTLFRFLGREDLLENG